MVLIYGFMNCPQNSTCFELCTGYDTSKVHVQNEPKYVEFVNLDQRFPFNPKSAYRANFKFKKKMY